MKKIILSVALLTGGFFLGIKSIQSCAAVASSSIGVSIIKQLLLGGINNASTVFSNREAFLKNDMVIKALPEGLQKVYNGLNRVSPSLAIKTKEYIADVAVATVNISTPILRNAVNDLNGNDVSRIMAGGEGVATQVLREKTEMQLVAALQPKVDEQLNQYGVSQLIDRTISLSSSLMGGGDTTIQQNKISQLVTQQLVNGIFYLIADYENDQKSEFTKKIKGGTLR